MKFKSPSVYILFCPSKTVTEKGGGGGYKCLMPLSTIFQLYRGGL